MPNGTEVGAKDFEELLRSGFSGRIIEQLSIWFISNFHDKLGTYQTRRLMLRVNYGTHLDLSGTKEWTEQAHGMLADWLKHRSSRNRGPRIMTFLLLLLLPESLFFVLRTRNPSIADAFAIAGILWIALLWYPLWYAASRMYRVPSIIIDNQIELPWYAQWAKGILVTIGLGILATAIYALLA
jgi:hypothetical protein